MADGAFFGGEGGQRSMSFSGFFSVSSRIPRVRGESNKGSSLNERKDWYKIHVLSSLVKSCGNS